MNKKDAVSELYDYFEKFVKEHTELTALIVTLKAKFNEDDTQLKDLLVEYKDNKLVIMPLLRASKSSANLLLIELLKINPDLLTKSICLNLTVPIPLLAHLLKHQHKYAEVFSWIRETNPNLMSESAQGLLDFMTEINKSPPIRTTTQSIETILKEVDAKLALSPHLAENVPEESVITRGPSSRPMPSTIIDSELLRSLSIPEHPLQLNSALRPYVNTARMVESIVLDAYLKQTFYSSLMSKGIMILPTIRHIEPISTELINQIKHQVPILSSDNIVFINGEVEAIPKLQTIDCPVQCLIIPVNRLNVHFTLLILYLNDDRYRAVYIDPIAAQYKAIKIDKEIHLLHSVQRDPMGQYPSAIFTELYKTHTQALVENLPILPQDIHYIHLGQNPRHNNYCSDYLIAVITLIAANKLELITNPECLHSLEGAYLGSEDVNLIRFLQIQRYGKPYFLNQRPKSIHSDAMLEIYDQVTQNVHEHANPVSLAAFHPDFIESIETMTSKLSVNDHEDKSDIKPTAFLYPTPTIQYASNENLTKKTHEVSTPPKPTSRIDRFLLRQRSKTGSPLKVMKRAEDICPKQDTTAERIASGHTPAFFKQTGDDILALPEGIITFAQEAMAPSFSCTDFYESCEENPQLNG